VIKLVENSSLPNGGALGSGKITDTLVTGLNGVNEDALPALSDQVWRCIVSVGPMLIRIRKYPTLMARCAIEG
jgi:hypothetical protein